MTPAARAWGVSCARKLHAPRILKAPMGWRFSHFTDIAGTEPPGGTGTSGVRTMRPPILSAAAWMSASPTSVAVTIGSSVRRALARTRELLVVVVARHLRCVGDAPAKLREKLHVVDGPGVIPVRLDLVFDLVVPLVLVLVLDRLRGRGVRADIVHRLAERERRNAGLRQREVIGPEEVTVPRRRIGSDHAHALRRQLRGHRTQRRALGAEQDDVAAGPRHVQ